MELLPERDPQKPDHAEDEPKRKPGQDLSPHHPPPVPEADLTDRHRPDNDRRSLASGIAATRNDKRNEQRKNQPFIQLPLVSLHRRRCQHLTQEEDNQPTRPLADQS